jgi:DNA-binding NarL/FixJ family response regulator
LSERGHRIPLEVRRKSVLQDGEVIGVIGVTRRIAAEERSCQILRRLLKASEDPNAMVARWETLTSSEKDVVQLVVDGAMNKMIARKLNIAERTVEARRSKIMKKLDLNSVPDLVRFHLIVQHWITPSAQSTAEPDGFERN